MVDAAGSGKIAIITGCASGIGLATTQLFLSHQYKVFGVDINEMDSTKIEQEHQGRFHFHRVDLTKDGACEEAVKKCVAEYGEKIDVLANVAGIMDHLTAADVYADSEWDRVIAVNLTVPTRLIRAVLPVMKAKKKGAIVNVSSKAGLSGATAGVAYTASKHGLLGVTKHTAWRFKDEGIRCNAVLPGAVETNISSAVPVEALDHASYATMAPVFALHIVPGQKPVVQASDIASGILFLASDQASMINGVSLPIDKAWSVV